MREELADARRPDARKVLEVERANEVGVGWNPSDQTVLALRDTLIPTKVASLR